VTDKRSDPALSRRRDPSSQPDRLSISTRSRRGRRIPRRQSPGLLALPRAGRRSRSGFGHDICPPRILQRSVQRWGNDSGPDRGGTDVMVTVSCRRCYPVVLIRCDALCIMVYKTTVPLEFWPIAASVPIRTVRSS